MPEYGTVEYADRLIAQYLNPKETSNPITAGKNEMVKELLENNQGLKSYIELYRHLGDPRSADPEYFLNGFDKIGKQEQQEPRKRRK